MVLFPSLWVHCLLVDQKWYGRTSGCGCGWILLVCGVVGFIHFILLFTLQIFAKSAPVTNKYKSSTNKKTMCTPTFNSFIYLFTAPATYVDTLLFMGKVNVVKNFIVVQLHAQIAAWTWNIPISDSGQVSFSDLVHIIPHLLTKISTSIHRPAILFYGFFTFLGGFLFRKKSKTFLPGGENGDREREWKWAGIRDQDRRFFRIGLVINYIKGKVMSI